jgi:hypothetical protein
MTEALLALIPGLAAAVLAWLWRREKKLTESALALKAAAFRELATSQKLILDLRAVLVQRNQELKDCRAKLNPADSLDDFFGLPKRDPNRNNS